MNKSFQPKQQYNYYIEGKGRMKANRIFLGWAQYSLGKLINLMLLVSILITSCKQPVTPTGDNNLETIPQPQVDEHYPTENNYTSPVYDHPQPIMGDREKIEISTVQESEDSIFPLEPSDNEPPLPGDDTIIPGYIAPPSEESQSLPNSWVNKTISFSKSAESSDILVAGGENIQGLPSIEYNTVTNRALAVWTELSASPPSIWGRRLSSNGIPSGEAFLIIDGQVSTPEKISLVHNSLDGSYMLLWLERNGGVSNQTFSSYTYSLAKFNLYLLPLSDTGVPIVSSPTLVTNTLTEFGNDSSWYDIVFNPNDEEYLVVWRQPPGGRRYIGENWYYINVHHVVGMKFDVNGNSIGQPVTLTDFADTDVNIGYDIVYNKYVLTFNRYGEGWCGFVSGTCHFYNNLFLYAQVFTTSLWPADWDWESDVPILYYIGGSTGHILNADLTYLQDSNAFHVIYWDNTAYFPDFHADIYARKILTSYGNYGVDMPVKLFSGVDEERTPGEFNSSANQTFVLAGVDELGGLDGMFLNPELVSSEPYQFTTGTLDWSITPVESETAPGWLAIWSKNNDIYVRNVPVNAEYFNGVFDMSILNGTCSTGGDTCQPQTNATATILGPINTVTGGLSYHTADISISTSSGTLNFLRTYSSLATDLFATDVGYGWTHNFDTRLIFPDDPGGEEGYVLFKEHTANLYPFYDLGNNTFSPVPGILGELTYSNGNYSLTLPNQSNYTFDANGRLLTWQDELGQVWEYSYNGSGQIQSVSADNDTHTLTLAYDYQGRITSVIDQTGRSIIYTYDTNGDLVNATNLTGGSWTYEYDSAHHLTRVVDPNGDTVEQTEYDAEGRAIKQWDGNDNLLGTLVYNTDGTTTITDSLGNVETHTYDDRLTLVANEDGTGGITEKTYDNNFRPLTITDEDGDTTTLAWSEDGNQLTQVVDCRRWTNRYYLRCIEQSHIRDRPARIPHYLCI